MADTDKFLEILTKLLEILARENRSKYVIVGDFNIDTLKTDNYGARELLTVLESFGVKAMVNEPTRITSLSTSCLDNVFTNIDNGKILIQQPHLSDHKSVEFSFKPHEVSLPKQDSYIECRNFSNDNIQNFIERLSMLDWSNLYSLLPHEVNEMWSCFSDQFYQIFKVSFPLISTKKGCTSGLYNFKSDTNLLQLRSRLDVLYTMSCVNNSYSKLYKSFKQDYDKYIAYLKKLHFENLIMNSSNKTKTTWRIVGDVTGRSKPNNTFPTGDSNTIVDRFVDFFTKSNKLPQSNKTIPQNFPYIKNSFYMFHISNKEVIDIVRVLRNSSAGYDEVPMKIIKKSIHQIVDPLTFIINASFVEGIFPDGLKLAIVKPILKKGSREDLGNYRPISLLTAFSKIFEKILCCRLLSFFRKFKIFNISQHGFLPTRSTNTAVFDLLNAVLTSVEQGELPVGLFLDLSKAFDTVDHDILLGKLKRYGVRDNQLRLLHSYLSNRRHRVEIGHGESRASSKEAHISCGVPQGSILGPLLFLIYVNDLPDALGSVVGSLSQYADDTNIVVSGDDLSSVVENTSTAFEAVNLWCEDNFLNLNVNKTEIIFFCTDHSRINFPSVIDIQTYNLSVSDSVKFLGIHVDKSLKWNRHVDYLNRKLASVLYSINVIKYQVGFETLKVVYFANMQSLLSYGIIFWGGSSYAYRIFVTQKMALRSMLRLPYRHSCRGLFRSNNILTVPALFILNSVLFLRKHSNLFINFRISNNTRQVVPYNLPKVTLSMTQKNVQFTCIKLYNALPTRLRSISEMNVFKKEVFRYLISGEPYCVDDFYNMCSAVSG